MRPDLNFLDARVRERRDYTSLLDQIRMVYWIRLLQDPSASSGKLLQHFFGQLLIGMA